MDRSLSEFWELVMDRRRKWQPTPVFLPGESHGQRCLVGYSPWGRKESEMTERLHFTEAWCAVIHGVTNSQTLLRDWTDWLTPMFITALFTMARTWKQPRCPLADEWIRMQQYIYSTEYYSAIKKNAFKYTEFRKMIITLYIRQQKRHRCEEQTFGLCGRRWGWDDLRE